MTNIPDGYGFVAGRSREHAKAIIAAAAKAGIDTGLVQTVADGYLAPEAAVLAYEGKSAAASEKGPSEDAPSESWKNADIKAWADAHEVDLGGATTKADMLAAISTADTKEE